MQEVVRASRRVWLIATVVAPVVLMAVLGPAGAGCRRDDAPASRGTAPGPPGSPQPVTPRLIALTPSATEVVAALGQAALLVGVDDYSVFPPEVTRLPKVGSFLAPNLETIVGLSPTLVIVDDVHG